MSLFGSIGNGYFNTLGKPYKAVGGFYNDMFGNGSGNAFGLKTSDGSFNWGMIPFVGAGWSNERNLQFQKEQQEYQRQLQNQIFGREDTATQRRMQDLMKAGLSPTLAAGSAASAGSVVNSQAPHGDDVSDSIAQVLSLIKMESDISTSQAQRELIKSQQNLTDISAAVKDWDYAKFVEWNLPSNAGGLAKTIRDLGSMLQGIGGNVITPAIKKFQDKIDYNKALINYNKAKSENDRLKDVKSGKWWKMTNKEVYNKIKGGSK